jgi:hypothetical protein
MVCLAEYGHSNNYKHPKADNDPLSSWASLLYDRCVVCMIGLNQCPSLPTCISNSVILLCNPRSCCCRAVFSPLREVICCWMRLFSAFWKLKWRFLHKLHFTSPPRCGPARSTGSSSRRPSSSSALIPACPSRCAGSAPPSCGC